MLQIADFALVFFDLGLILDVFLDVFLVGFSGVGFLGVGQLSFQAIDGFFVGVFFVSELGL